MTRKASTANGATFQQRWCLEEDLQFLEAMRLVGYGKWTRISEIMGGSRTPLQVKNRARHLLMYEVDSPLAQELKQLANMSSKHAILPRPASQQYKQHNEYTVRSTFSTKPTEDVDFGEILLSEEEVEDSLDAADIESESTLDDSEEAVRADIIALWNSQKPLQLSLEFLFEALPDRNMESVTAMYYQLEEENLINSNIPRKRRVRDENGNWVEAAGEGRTIAHDPQAKVHKRRRTVPLRSTHKHAHDDSDFELFEPQNHTENGPFVVKVAEWILKVIEMHSLLSTNEIIGLLGGTVDTSDKTIQVTKVFPCVASDSTGIECEMDPLSEMQACEYFEEHSVSLIGWYHSHPTFAAHPSKRDIDTQTMYQTVFTNGFVGVIIRPTDPPNWSCFHVQDGLPYRIDMINTVSGNQEKDYIQMLNRAIKPLKTLNVDDRTFKRLLSLAPNDQYKRLLSSLRGEIDVEL